MAIYIENLDLPKDRFYPIHATIYADGTVTTGHGIGESVKEAVPVPPHGRLIDADVLEDEGADVHEDVMCCGYVEDTIWGFSHDRIRNAPTIIPASEGR